MAKEDQVIPFSKSEDWKAYWRCPHCRKAISIATIRAMGVCPRCGKKVEEVSSA